MAYALVHSSRASGLTSVRQHRPARRAGHVIHGRGLVDLVQPRVTALMPMPVLQTKLNVGAPNDRFEEEAHRVADQVMRLADPPRTDAPDPVGEVAPGGIQRLCAECEEEVMRRTADDEEDELQMQRAARATPQIGPGLQAEIRGLRGGGQRLSAAERAFFEARFGHDFGQVRIHTDAHAMALAHAVGARAFTVGTDIVLGDGEHARRTETGRKLLAHELTHTLQQHDGEAVQRLTISPIVNRMNPSWTCGQHMRHWKFELSTGAPDEGYMVQQIDYSLNLQGCPSSGLGSFTATETFWEAWRHNKGGTLDAGFTNFTDHSTRASDPGKIGQVRSLGTVKFFLKTTTGDLGDVGRNPTTVDSRNKGWSTTAVPMSGGQPALKGPTAPPWWNDPPVEGPATREAGADWQCCGVASDFSRPFGKP